MYKSEPASILFVSATPFEVQPLVEKFKFTQHSPNLWQTTHDGKRLEVLVTGIGMTNTAYHLGKHFAQNRPQLAIHAGIAGSFDREIALTEVVEVVEDSFAELGAEDHDEFLDLQQLGFPSLSLAENNYYNTFHNPHPSPFDLRKVTALTLNQASGNMQTIVRLQTRWGKQVESMETAAFFQSCTAAQIPFWAFRSISNYVEPRNRAAWRVKEAIQSLNAFLIEKAAHF